MGDLNILSRPVCWSVIERTNKYAGSRYILKPDELSIPGQLARDKSFSETAPTAEAADAILAKLAE